MATTEDMSQSSAADGIKMLPKSDLVGKNQESREDKKTILEAVEASGKSVEEILKLLK